MKTEEKLLQAIENRKGGMYKSYYLQKNNSVSSDINQVVFAYKNGRGSGYISQDGINHLMYIPDCFFEDKEPCLSIYIGETERYTYEESGLLHDLYKTTIGEIKKSIEEENKMLEKEAEEMRKQIKKAEKERKEWQAVFDAAKPNDLINSGYGYMIRKKDYHLAQKYGYDGIELIN